MLYDIIILFEVINISIMIEDQPITTTPQKALQNVLKPIYYLWAYSKAEQWYLKPTIKQIKNYHINIVQFNDMDKIQKFYDEFQYTASIITSTQLIQQVLKKFGQQIHKIKIKNIYLFCDSDDKAKQFKTKFPNITNVFPSLNKLKSYIIEIIQNRQIYEQRKIFPNQMMDIQQYQINQLCVKRQCIFSLLKFKNRQKAKHDFMELAKLYIQKKTIDLSFKAQQIKILKEFQGKYNKKDLSYIIKLYTQENFFHTLVDSILKSTNDPKIAAFVRLPFRDIFESVKQLYQREHRNQNIQAYAAICFTQKQINSFKVNINGYVQLTSFLAMSPNIIKGNYFINNPHYNTKLVINFPKNKRDQQTDYGYANIEKYCNFNYLNYILINPLNIFQVVDVTQQKLLNGKVIHLVHLEYGCLARAKEKIKSGQSLTSQQQWMINNYDQKKTSNSDQHKRNTLRKKIRQAIQFNNPQKQIQKEKDIFRITSRNDQKSDIQQKQGEFPIKQSQKQQINGQQSQKQEELPIKQPLEQQINDQKFDIQQKQVEFLIQQPLKQQNKDQKSDIQQKQGEFLMNQSSKQQINDQKFDIQQKQEEPQIFEQVLTVETKQYQYNNIILQRKIQQNEDNREQIKISVKNCEQILEKKADIFSTIDQINEEDHNIMSIIVDTIMNKPYNQQQKSISNQIQTKLKANVQQNGDSFNLILLILKKQLEDRGFTVNLQQKSSVRTKLSIKILMTGFMTDKIKCIETIQQGESEWSFKDIKKSILSIKKFEQWYKQKKAMQFGVPKNQITIHQITNCCTKVKSSMPNNAAAGTAGNKKQKPQRNQQFTAYFSNYISLSIEDFDTKGDIKFKNQKQDIQRRGGWPYYQPIKCNRYGLKISGKYDKGDNSWLLMDGNPKQWAVAFHGVNYPASSINIRNDPGTAGVNPSNSTQHKNKLQSIMSGLNRGQMLSPHGPNHSYQNQNAVNKPEVIGKGIYCTPHIQVALEYAHASFKKRLVLQCRANPKQILICSGKQQYWVIRQSKNIRPYGIILIDENLKLPTQTEQFKETFKWSKYESQIKEKLKKMG